MCSFLPTDLKILDFKFNNFDILKEIDLRREGDSKLQVGFNRGIEMQNTASENKKIKETNTLPGYCQYEQRTRELKSGRPLEKDPIKIRGLLSSNGNPVDF